MSRDIYKETHYIFATSLGVNMVDDATPEGTVHISNGSAGSISSYTNYHDLVVEASTTPGISILTPDDQWAGIAFRSTGDNYGARIVYNYDDGPTLSIGTSNSGGVLKLSSGDSSTALTIDSSQNIGIGTTSPDHMLHMVSTSNNCDIVLQQDSGSTGAADLRFLKSRSGAAAQSGDVLGIIKWRAHDGTDFENTAAHLSVKADATVSGNDTPGAMYFATTSDGSSSATDRMVIKSDGKVGIGTTSPLSLLHVADPSGSPAIYISGASTEEGDIAWPSSESLTMGEWSGSAFTARLHIDSAGDVGINTTSPSTTLHVVDTTEQLRLGYDASNYASFTVDSGGDLTIDPSGGDVTIAGNLKFGDSATLLKDSGGTTRIKIEDGDDMCFYDDGGSKRMVVGSSSDAYPGGIGIGTATNASAALHVKDDAGSNEIVCFDQTSDSNQADVLKLWYSGHSSHSSFSTAGANNYIIFGYGTASYAGAIDIDAGTTASGSASSSEVVTTSAVNDGITLRSGTLDFGEWLPLGDQYEWGVQHNGGINFPIEEGTVVFVRDRLVRKNPPGIPMIITNRALVCGNSPMPRSPESYIPGVTLSFIGQVPVKIVGPVMDGDYILPSEERVGLCKAIRPDAITFQEYIKTIGVALGGYSGPADTCLVWCAIGVKNKYASEL